MFQKRSREFPLGVAAVVEGVARSMCLVDFSCLRRLRFTGGLADDDRLLPDGLRGAGGFGRRG